jgi:hypothetical protein
MGSLFLGLDPHPLGEALEVGVFEVAGHGQVEVGRREFPDDLLVDGVGKALIQHDVSRKKSSKQQFINK